MGTILNVTYVSQKDKATAGYSINDCGPTCVAMMADTIGKNVTPNQVYKDAGITAKGPLSVTTMQQSGNLYGLNLQRHDTSSDAGLTNLMGWLDGGRPALVLVDYFPVMRANLHESRINGGHFVVAVGYDDNYIYVHDPYWDGQGGAYRTWPINVWNEAWFQHGTQYQKVCLAPRDRIAQPKTPPYPIPADILKRIRARAMFENTPAPIPANDADYQTALKWLGDWGKNVTTYTIQSGDTLGAVADHIYGSSEYYRVIAIFNDIADVNRVEVGQTLYCPLPGAATVPSFTPTGSESAGSPVTAQPPAAAPYAFTNQQVINAFHDIFTKRGDVAHYWDYATAAGLGYLPDHRSERYSGPRIEDLPNLPDDVKQELAAALGISRG